MADPDQLTPSAIPEAFKPPSAGTYIGQPKPVANIPAIESGQFEQGIQPDSDEVFDTLDRVQSRESAIGYRSGDTGRLFRYVEEKFYEDLYEAEGQQKIDPKVAKEQYGIDTDEPIFPEQAQRRAEIKSETERLKRWAARGAPLGTLDTLTLMGKSALDPVNLSLTLAGGAVLTALKVPVKPLTVFSENLAGNVTGDVLTYYSGRALGEDVNFNQLLTNSIVGAATGVGIHYGLKGVSYGIGKTVDAGLSRFSKAYKDLPIETRAKFARFFAINEEAGKKIDSSVTTPSYQARLDGVVNPKAGVPYEYAAKTYFSGSQASVDAPVVLESKFGDTIQLSTNRADIENVAGNPDAATSGAIRSYGIDKELNLIDANTKASVLNDVVELAKKRFGDLPEFKDAETIGDILDIVDDKISRGKIEEDTRTIFNHDLKEAGFDGYKVSGDGGEKIAVFSDKDLRLVEEFQAEKANVPKDDPVNVDSFINSVGTPGRHRNWTPEIEKELKENADPKKYNTLEALDEFIEERGQAIEKVLKKKAEIDPEIKRRLEKITKETQELVTADDIRAMNDVDACVTKGRS